MTILEIVTFYGQDNDTDPVPTDHISREQKSVDKLKTVVDVQGWIAEKVAQERELASHTTGCPKHCAEVLETKDGGRICTHHSKEAHLNDSVNRTMGTSKSAEKIKVAAQYV